MSEILRITKPVSVGWEHVFWDGKKEHVVSCSKEEYLALGEPGAGAPPHKKDEEWVCSREKVVYPPEIDAAKTYEEVLAVTDVIFSPRDDEAVLLCDGEFKQLDKSFRPRVEQEKLVVDKEGDNFKIVDGKAEPKNTENILSVKAEK
jgi:hypothetical protein